MIQLKLLLLLFLQAKPIQADCNYAGGPDQLQGFPAGCCNCQDADGTHASCNRDNCGNWCNDADTCAASAT